MPPTRKEEVEMDLSELEAVTQRLLQQSLNYNEEEAAIITRVLLYAQMRGNSQGVIKLVTGGVPASDASTHTDIEVEHETKVSARLHGHGTAGMLVLHRATSMAIQKAREHGLSIVATHGTSSGTGAIGFYARSVADNGLVGIILSQSPELMAPHGSYEPIFGTNPFAFGIPRDDTSIPIVLDMATSAYAWYALKEARAAGQPIPPDVAYDAEGHPTRDPSAALSGALRVFDRSHKGSHIALMVELLAGGLTGADVEEKWQRENWGNLVVAIDPEVLGQGLAQFTAKVEAVVRRVEGAKPLPGATAQERGDGSAQLRSGGDVRGPSLPGSRSEAEAATVAERGRIRLERSVYENLMKEVASI
ncbi:ureidoglycolate dehydrogenase [Nannochloropsis gaditana]|uniref:Ureidoglycolate dehydrogenase n=1 Tax=Nannochloropsis gaditana TaxID=72520 RepID=W7U3V9_9STRA|nr:ureidoglycolate dehydrogenase [Nannochloropsis gaditana]